MKQYKIMYHDEWANKYYFVKHKYSWWPFWITDGELIEPTSLMPRMYKFNELHEAGTYVAKVTAKFTKNKPKNIEVWNSEDKFNVKT